ncbi:hypothetical protein K443DRAFT_684218 [Laccaria amethystina LaAM-08-1]|uniref:Uncharacterized protein n=1 Tax=Laccaria amethystina LaAM-08-1 TaxID=1095629 RepID=A0A0C9WY08_9AGAR|nr:hypothetical protein K443DRAFT_684218 [Laccaria amethystina LaAM-08-1]
MCQCKRVCGKVGTVNAAVGHPILTCPCPPLNEPSDIRMSIQASKETPLDQVLPYTTPSSVA